jgi:phage baseplate assembly protein W
MHIPFNVTGGRVATTTTPRQIIEQKIVNVLTTGKLERVSLPLYGVGLQSILFGSMDDLVAVDFKTDAATELTSNVTGITILDITVRATTESEAEVTVYYRTPLSSTQSTTFYVVVPDLLDEESIII